MKQDIACSNILFLAQFHRDFLTQHFEWLQAVDHVAKKPGFRSRQILVRHCLMRKDLTQLKARINCDSFGDRNTNLNHFDAKEEGRQHW